MIGKIFCAVQNIHSANLYGIHRGVSRIFCHCIRDEIGEPAHFRVIVSEISIVTWPLRIGQGRIGIYIDRNRPGQEVFQGIVGGGQIGNRYAVCRRIVLVRCVFFVDLGDFIA